MAKVIVLTHAKGHGLSGIGGTIKNLGIGLVGKKGKAAMHFLGDITIDPGEMICGVVWNTCFQRCDILFQPIRLAKFKHDEISDSVLPQDGWQDLDDPSHQEGK